MTGSTELALVSDRLVLSALAVYVGAFAAYCAEWACGTRSRATREAAAAAAREARTPALVGAAAAGSLASRPPGPPGGPAPLSPGTDRAGRIGVALTLLGAALHAAGTAARGLATGRVPLGNMYEFAVSGALAVVGAYLVLLVRRRDRRLGPFVLVPVTLALALAATVLHTGTGPLVPALRSYWLGVHVAAAALCTGVFTLGALGSALYLVRARLARRGGGSPVWEQLPGAAALDRLAHRAAAFAFPLWTFAVLAGAVWAESAWGRYWAWDPKETWAFITWVGYAAYLHARATAGWNRSRTAWINLTAYGCFLFNFVGVNLFVSGLHSYARV